MVLEAFVTVIVSAQVHRKYTGEDFDEDLRTVLRRSGCKNEKIAFIMDESNVLDSGFLERMNTLLANGEVRHVPMDDRVSWRPFCALNSLCCCRCPACSRATSTPP